MKKFMFKVYDDSLENFLDCQSNLSEFIRSILDDYRTGKLVEKTSIDFDEEMNQEKLKKIKKENIKLNLDNRFKLIHNLKVSPERAIKIASGEKKLDDGTLHCPDCEWWTDPNESINTQINSMVGHMKIHHKRDLTEKEAEEFTRLLI